MNRQLELKYVKELIPYANNPRRNKNAVGKVADSIKSFGFNVPIIINKDNIILAGHTRFEAAKTLQMEKVPCYVIEDLDEAKERAFRIADNKTNEFADWDYSLLQVEIEELYRMDCKGFELTSTGFDLSDIESLCCRADSLEQVKNLTNVMKAPAPVAEASEAELDDVGSTLEPEREEEIDLSKFDDTEFKCRCPRCGFRFNP